MSIDWSRPLRVAGTDRPAICGGKPHHNGQYKVWADWEGNGNVDWWAFDGAGQCLSVGADYEIENTPYAPTPARDPDTARRVAREAAARHVEDAQGSQTYAINIRRGTCDDHGIVQAALLAYTHGTDLLKPAEPPEVRKAREYARGWTEDDDLRLAAHDGFLAGWRARKQEGK
jgi:hypothetical protein